MDLKKVLVIDDEPLIIKTALLLLKNAGVQGIGALNGQEGLDAASREMPSLILLDLKMPKMSGWDVLARIKQDEKLKGIPVAIFSSETIADSQRVARELSVVDILQKPLDEKKLKALFALIGLEAAAPAGEQQAPPADPPVHVAPKRIVVERNMTGAFVKDLEKRFLDTMQSVHGSAVVLDLTDIGVIDSQGLALCVGLKKECDRKSAPFSIEASPEIHKLFKLCKLSRVIEMKEVSRP
jgi:anti-anti-sigma factor